MIAEEENAKRRRVAEDKNQIFEVLAAEYPGQVKFLSSFGVDEKERALNAAAQATRGSRE